MIFLNTILSSKFYNEINRGTSSVDVLLNFLENINAYLFMTKC